LARSQQGIPEAAEIGKIHRRDTIEICVTLSKRKASFSGLMESAEYRFLFFPLLLTVIKVIEFHRLIPIQFEHTVAESERAIALVVSISTVVCSKRKLVNSHYCLVGIKNMS
jgi:hypothetical protein